MVHIICDEPGRSPGETGAVSFLAFVGAIPRIGERIVLQDGKACDVRRLYHKVVTLPGNIISLQPTVLAIRSSPDQPEG